MDNHCYPTVLLSIHCIIRHTFSYIDLLFNCLLVRARICSVIFCEAVAIYGVVVAIILQTKIEFVDPSADGSYSSKAMYSGYSIFGSGLTCWFANLVCGCVSLCCMCYGWVTASAESHTSKSNN